MRNILYLLSFAALILACGKNTIPSQNQPYTVKDVASWHDGFYITSNSITPVRSGEVIKDSTDSYFIPNGLRPLTMTKYAENPQSNTAITNYNVRIVADSSLVGRLSSYGWDLKWTNTILKKLNTGIQLSNIGTVEYFTLDSMNTGGRVNTDKIIAELRDIVDYRNSDIIIALYRDTDFFNTANAIAINHGKGVNKKRYIFGDGELLLSPMILIHEIGHSLGLTHSNEIMGGRDCNMYNIMHESNIGCTIGFNARQLLLMSGDGYIVEIDSASNRYYPTNDGYNCFCDMLDNKYNTELEKYLNSIDRNIDDTPLIGDLDIMRELDMNADTAIIRDELSKFYEIEYKKYIGSDLDSMNTYISKRWQAHKKLRANNMARLILENATELSIYNPDLSVADILNSTAEGLSLFDSINSKFEIIDDCDKSTYCETHLKCKEQKIEELNEDVENLKNEISIYIEQITKLEEGIDTLKYNNNINVGKIANLEELLDSLNNSNQYYRSVSEKLTENRENLMKDVNSINNIIGDLEPNKESIEKLRMEFRKILNNY